MKNSNFGFWDLTAMNLGVENRNKEMKVFDWVKAANLIKEHQPEVAEAGLENDWNYTGGIIYKNGQIVKDTYTYLASTWATPTLILDDKSFDCYVMESETNWSSDTKWPEEAVSILGS